MTRHLWKWRRLDDNTLRRAKYLYCWSQCAHRFEVVGGDYRQCQSACGVGEPTLREAEYEERRMTVRAA